MPNDSWTLLASWSQAQLSLIHIFPSQTQCILSTTTFICELLQYIHIIASLQVSSHSLQSRYNKAPPSSMLASTFTQYTSTHFSHIQSQHLVENFSTRPQRYVSHMAIAYWNYNYNKVQQSIYYVWL